MSSVAASEPDDHPLRIGQRPNFEAGDTTVSLVDLFAGCGGLTLGVAQAAHEQGAALKIPLALDFERAALEIYGANFPKAKLHEGPVDDLFDGQLGKKLTTSETKTREQVGRIAALVGGPPCQGHSNLNNHTRRKDIKNALYARMARAAEVLEPSVILIENVPAVQHDKGGIVGIVVEQLRRLDYDVASRVLRLDRLGVAQTRKRHVLLAVRGLDISPVDAFVDALASTADGRDLRWAIGDLESVDPSGSIVDSRPRASAENQLRLQWLHENDKYDLPNSLRPDCHQDEHSYKSMYGRLRWDAPAQTLTSGYTSIGQGRYGHPSQPRALTAHEAARIQGFPDYFDFSLAQRRTALSTMIGNAVPPALACALFRPLVGHLAVSVAEQGHADPAMRLPEGFAHSPGTDVSDNRLESSAA